MARRIILITGAAGGLGSVMTAALLDAGHGVAAVDYNSAGSSGCPLRSGRQSRC